MKKLFMALCLFVSLDASASIIDKANLNPKVEEVAQKYLKNEGFDYKDFNVWSDYLSGVSKAVWSVLGMQGNYVDSADLEAVTYREMASIVSNLRFRLIQEFQLNQKIDEIINQTFVRYGVYEKDVLWLKQNEFNQKKNEIRNEAQKKINRPGKGYIEYFELSQLVERKLVSIINYVHNYLNNSNSSTNTTASTASSWVSWLASLFGGTQQNVVVTYPIPSAPPAPTPASTSEDKIYQWQLDKTVKDKVAEVLGAKGVKVQDIPQKAQAEYYRKIQKMIYALNKIMTDKVRDYVFISELDHEVRKEIDSVLDLMATSCSICLDKYQAGDKTCKLNCGHVFHEDCLDAALRVKKSCPICNAANVFVVERKSV